MAYAFLPSNAYAGTTTVLTNVAFTITGQCIVEGGTVNLGTYTNRQTWRDVAQSLGYFVVGSNGDVSGNGLTVGSRGLEYANYGSVTCDANIPYKLTVRGSGASSNMIRISIGQATALFMPALKRVGGEVAPNNGGSAYGDSGHQFAFGPFSGSGTGKSQELLGSAVINLSSATESNVQSGASLSSNGTYSDTLVYTLEF